MTQAAPLTRIKPARPSTVGTQFATLSMICGVNPAPSITPMIIVIGGRTAPGAAIGARTSEASVQAVMDPSIHGRGRPTCAKSHPPSAPTSRAAVNRTYGNDAGAKVRSQPFNAIRIPNTSTHPFDLAALNQRCGPGGSAGPARPRRSARTGP